MRPRFSDSDFKSVYVLNDVALKSFKGRMGIIIIMGIRIRSLPPRKPMDPTDLGST